MARDPPSYDSGTLLSEADAKTIMDKIEARRKWLKANGKARGRPPLASYLGKHQRVILARAKSKADVTMDATTNKPSDVDMIAVDDLSQENPHDKEDFELTCDPPSYDSGTPLSEVDANTLMDKIEVRTKWLQANGKARKLQEADPECSLAIFPECDEGRSVKKCSIEQRDLKRDKKCPRAMTVEHHGRRLHDAKGSDKAYRWKTWCVVNGECWGSNVPVLPLTDVKMVATPNKPFDVDGHRPPRGTPPHKRAALGGAVMWLQRGQILQ